MVEHKICKISEVLVARHDFTAKKKCLQILFFEETCVQIIIRLEKGTLCYMNMTNYTFIDVDGEKAAMYVSYGQSTQDGQRKY